jgi:UDP-N-acetylmuramoylalanine--D-glutamate ligase
VAAITGTNGKTTVTSLISEMLVASGVDARPLGNIGTPLADAVGTDLQVAVVEVSSFQLHYSDRFRPDVAVVTNVAPDHLDWHGSFDRYLEAKARIVEHQGPEDLLVYCSDDGVPGRIAERAPGRRIGVGSRRGVCRRVRDRPGRRPDGAGRAVDRPESHPGFRRRLPGRPGAGGGSRRSARRRSRRHRGVIRNFTPGAHRRTVVGEIDGVRFVDDSKATNPHAALAAIRSYPSVVLIAGGLAKGLDVAPLATEPNVRAVIAIGESAPVLLAAAGDRGVAAPSMSEAVAEACAVAEPGDVVLLAPGCASFDMFDSYGHRGDVFAAEVAARGGRS